MADTWFTADFHLGHFNIIGFCKRPFADTPEMNEAIIERLNHELVSALHKPEVKEKLLAANTEAIGSSVEQFKAAIKTYMARWSKVIKDAHIRAD